NSPAIWIRDIASGIDTKILSVDRPSRVFALDFTPGDADVDVLMRRDFGWPFELNRVAASGGALRPVTTGVYSGIGYSLDGRSMAFVREDQSRRGRSAAVIVANADGSNEHVLTTLNEPDHFPGVTWSEDSPNRPAWSPDGRTIALATFRLSHPVADAGVALI